MLKSYEYKANLSVRTRFSLFSLSRNIHYYQTKSKGSYNAAGKFILDNEISNQIHDLWLKYPFYGYRKITATLKREGYNINHKKVLRLMKEMKIRAIYPKKTTISNKNDYKYPYLLRNIRISKVNQVWQIDITYLKLSNGFVYLAALIDVYSRFVLSWKISNIMDTEFCLSVLDKALSIANPEIINSDQGSQFTANNWVNSLKENNIRISMDGKGRWLDNVFIERFWRTVKYEEFFINPPDNIKDLTANIKQFVTFYNNERPHQKLNYKVPAEIFYQKS